MKDHKDSELIEAINAAPKIVRDFIHEMDSWDYSEQCYELFHLREQVKAQKWTIKNLRDQVEALKKFDGG